MYDPQSDHTFDLQEDIYQTGSIEISFRDENMNEDSSTNPLEIIYDNAGLEETHSQVGNFQSFLTIFGLDTRNSNGSEIKDPTNAFYLGDGKIDNSTIFINPIHGELFFPAHLEHSAPTCPFRFERYTLSFNLNIVR